MSVDEFLKEVDSVKGEWDERAFRYVVDAARKILDEQPDDVDEFVMAMGGYSFTAKRGGAYDPDLFTEEEFDSDRIRMDSYGFLPEEFAPEFSAMINRLDDEVGVMGNPVRFKRGTKPVYSWGDTVKQPVQYEQAEST